MSNHFFDSFVVELKQKFQSPLPGEKAHANMLALSGLRMAVKPNEKTRKSAVLIVFYPYQGEVHLPLILRPAYDGVHSGQMAFPGGRYELLDEDLIRTAKREAQEEIGLRITGCEGGGGT